MLSDGNGGADSATTGDARVHFVFCGANDSTTADVKSTGADFDAGLASNSTTSNGSDAIDVWGIDTGSG